MPQLNGPVSVQSRSGRRVPENARIEQDSFQRMTTSHRREYTKESSDDVCNDRRTNGGQRPHEEVMLPSSIYIKSSKIGQVLLCD